jgi:hypothetical protein
MDRQGLLQRLAEADGPYWTQAAQKDPAIAENMYGAQANAVVELLIQAYDTGVLDTMYVTEDVKVNPYLGLRRDPEEELVLPWDRERNCWTEESWQDPEG